MELARYNNPFGAQNFEVAIRFFKLYTPDQYGTCEI